MKTEEGALTFPFSGPRGAQFIVETTGHEQTHSSQAPGGVCTAENRSRPKDAGSLNSSKVLPPPRGNAELHLGCS